VNPLDLPLIADIRRNHALEHATINVLSESCADLNLVGRSDWTGFTLYGPIHTDEVAAAASIALERLRAGEGRCEASRGRAWRKRCNWSLAWRQRSPWPNPWGSESRNISPLQQM
jgi:hypothetical protein